MPGPSHIGIDNLACVKNFVQLIQLATLTLPTDDVDSKAIHNAKLLHCTGQLRKHWSMQRNGDLWRFLFKCI